MKRIPTTIMYLIMITVHTIKTKINRRYELEQMRRHFTIKFNRHDV
jgi:hypothetical protein